MFVEGKRLVAMVVESAKVPKGHCIKYNSRRKRSALAIVEPKTSHANSAAAPRSEQRHLRRRIAPGRWRRCELRAIQRLPPLQPVLPGRAGEPPRE